ncbi:MAG: hypothetical protein ACE145_17405 [Terriglobia bacterium]
MRYRISVKSKFCAAWFLIALWPLAADKTISAVKVPQNSVDLLKPILEKSAGLYRDPECRGSDYQGHCNDLFEQYQDRMFDLFELKNQDADEALVVLFAFPSAHGYTRKPHPTEALTCAVAERGERMLPLLSKYKGCNPNILGDYPAQMRRTDCEQEMSYAREIITGHHATEYCR